MRKMKSVKQPMTTVLSLMLAVLTIAVCAPDQTIAQVRGRARAKHQGITKPSPYTVQLPSRRRAQLRAKGCAPARRPHRQCCCC